jgi:signal transduction histidine kinase
MNARRRTYFMFQGLLMAVLLLIFHYQYQGRAQNWARPAFLASVLASSLACLIAAPEEVLAGWWFQAGLFVGDALLAALTLRWTQTQSELYLIYFLIIFGTALARDVGQSLAVASVTSALYLFSARPPGGGLPRQTEFWLRFLLLWITASLLAILARDTERAQAEERERYEERLVAAGRLATLGRFAAEVAHRIKGPLTTIMVNAEVLSIRHAESRQLVKELGEIKEEAARCKEILKNLLDLGRIEEMDAALFDLREPLRLALKRLEPQVRARAISVEFSGLEAALAVKGDQSLLQEALTAVLQNAVEASLEGGKIAVKARRRGGDLGWRRYLPGRRCYVIDVEDGGAGIAKEDLGRIFEPFFTTKDLEGSGLGLSTALRILQKHDGLIEAASAGRGRGARFRLIIPAAEGSRPSGS